MGEFFESRSALYSHDKLRYPMYFGGNVIVPDAFSIIPKSSSATLVLAQNLQMWGTDPQAAGEREREAKKVVLESLLRRDDRAVTAALFSKASNAYEKPKNVIGQIRRKISVEYTKHFMSSLNSDLCTGMKGIEYFDRCCNNFPMYDIPILAELATIVGMSHLIDTEWPQCDIFWENILYARRPSEELLNLQYQVELLGLALSHMYASDQANTHASFRIWARQALQKTAANSFYAELDVSRNALNGASLRVQNLIGGLSNNSLFLAGLQLGRAKMESHVSFDCLLIVATEVEQKAVFEKVQAIGNPFTLKVGGGRAYYDLGFVYGRRVALVKTAMGSTTVGGSTATSMQMISHLNPHFVIMVGIAFGVDRKKQSIGTVLIAKQLLGYELQRVGTDKKNGDVKITLRGPKTDTSPVLMSLLDGAASVWNEAPVKSGLMLSGEKLIDNLDYREQLNTISGGEAIGGEMEGVGLLIAVAEKPTHWIVVKAVCDWADGNKSKNKEARQATAAKNAVSLVFRALEIAPDDLGS